MTLKTNRFKAEMMTSTKPGTPPKHQKGRKTRKRVRQKNEGKTGKKILLPSLQVGGKLRSQRIT